MQKRKSKSSKARLPEALAMLIEDHKKVQKMFKEFEKASKEEGMEEDLQALVEQTCKELTVHTQLEEEIFYPAVRQGIEEEIMDEAEVEHEVAKNLIKQLEGMQPDDERYHATFKVLGEYVNHHIEEEQNEMFKQIKRLDIDLESIAKEMQERKQELAREAGLTEEEESEESKEELQEAAQRNQKRGSMRSYMDR